MYSKDRILLAITWRKFKLLTKLRLNNFFINRIVSRASFSDLQRLPIPVENLELREEDYFKLLEVEPLQKYNKFAFLHSKPLEYLSTITLLGLQGGEDILDAAGGAEAEYLNALRAYTKLPLKLYCQDALVLPNNVDNGMVYIGGSIENVALPDESLDCITCHHSFEHFQGNLDVLFIKESVRLLRPNGKLIIIPLFLADKSAEIWNKRPSAHFDAEARQIYDFTASFGGWGPFEGFARTYSSDDFQRKILSIVPPSCSARIFEITVNKEPVPDIASNRHQPKVNGGMRALVIQKR